MRRITFLLASGLATGLLAAPAAAADRTTPTIGPLPTVQNLPIAGCTFAVLMTDRGGRTLTTTYDGDTVVRQMITGASDVELTNASSGNTLPLTIQERAVYELHADGTTTLTQTGQSGLAIDPGTITHTPNITWFSGTATTVGRLDATAKIPLFATVEKQSVSGLADDVCEMLETGLKTRH
jgi:hypothetical protein